MTDIVLAFIASMLAGVSLILLTSPSHRVFLGAIADRLDSLAPAFAAHLRRILNPRLVFVTNLILTNIWAVIAVNVISVFVLIRFLLFLLQMLFSMVELPPPDVGMLKPPLIGLCTSVLLLLNLGVLIAFFVTNREAREDPWIVLIGSLAPIVLLVYAIEFHYDSYIALVAGLIDSGLLGVIAILFPFALLIVGWRASASIARAAGGVARRYAFYVEEMEEPHMGSQFVGIIAGLGAIILGLLAQLT